LARLIGWASAVLAGPMGCFGLPAKKRRKQLVCYSSGTPPNRTALSATLPPHFFIFFLRKEGTKACASPFKAQML